MNEAPRFRLNSASYQEEEYEAVPDLEVAHGDGQDSRSSTDGLAVSSGSADSEVAQSSLAHLESQDRTEPAIAVTRRMTTLEFFIKKQVRSQTSNRTVIAALDQILMVFLFLAAFVEQPLNYLIRNFQSTGSSNRPRNKEWKPPIRQGIIQTSLGSIYYLASQATSPTKVPILCLHAEDRSADEFREILPLLAATGRRVVALDVLGYGKSENPSRSCRLGEWAAACREVADSLMMQQFICIGSHGLGTTLAMLLASQHPDRVRGCIHINLLYHPRTITGNDSSTTSTSATTKTPSSTPISRVQDDVMTALQEFEHRDDDGLQFRVLREARKSLNPDVQLRCFQSDLEWINHRQERSHRSLTLPKWYSLDMEAVAPQLRSPQLCVSGSSALATWDSKGWSATQRFDSACRLFAQCEVTSLTGPTSTRYLLNQAPQEVVSLVTVFLDKHSL